MGDPEFPQRLAEVRTKRRLTQSSLARKAGLPAATISHFETGFRFPTAATLTKLAEALEVSVDELLGRRDTGDPVPEGPRLRAIFRHARELSEESLAQLEWFSQRLKERDEEKGMVVQRPLAPDRAQAVRGARLLLERLGNPPPPIDPLAIAQELGIVVEESDRLGTSFSGCLMKAGSTFGILYSNALSNLGFQRFTVAHELGHHQLTHHHAALFAEGGQHLSESNYTSNQWHEVEADAFAGELLMPRLPFLKEIGRCPPGRVAVKRLAEKFQTSWTSTAIRYAELTPDPVAIIVSEGNKISYCFPSKPLGRIHGAFIRRGTQVPRNTVTYRFNRDPANVRETRQEEGIARLSTWFEDPAQDFEVHEDVMGLGRYGKTLTVLYAIEMPDDEEE